MNYMVAQSTPLGDLVTFLFSLTVLWLMRLIFLHRVSEISRNLSWLYANDSHLLAETWLLRGAFPIFERYLLQCSGYLNWKTNLFVFFNWPDLIRVCLKRGGLESVQLETETEY